MASSVPSLAAAAAAAGPLKRTTSCVRALGAAPAASAARRTGRCSERAARSRTSSVIVALNSSVCRLRGVSRSTSLICTRTMCPSRDPLRGLCLSFSASDTAAVPAHLSPCKLLWALLVKSATRPTWQPLLKQRTLSRGSPQRLHGHAGRCNEEMERWVTSSEKPICSNRSASSSTSACRSSSPTDWVLRRWSIRRPCAHAAMLFSVNVAADDVAQKRMTV